MMWQVRGLARELDRAVHAEHVAGLERDVARAADVRDVLEAILREAERLVHVHRDAGLGALLRHVHQLLVGDLDHHQVRFHLVEHLFGRELRVLLVVLEVRLRHAHHLRGGVVHHAHDLVEVRQLPEPVELALRVVVRDAPQHHAHLALANGLPLRPRRRGIDAHTPGDQHHQPGRQHLHAFHLHHFTFPLGLSIPHFRRAPSTLSARQARDRLSRAARRRHAAQPPPARGAAPC